MALTPFDGQLDDPAAASPALQPFDGVMDSEKTGAARRLGDVGISLAKGVIGVPEAAVGIADLATGGRAGKFLDEKAGFRPKQAKDMLDEYYSPEQKAANAAVQKADGFFPTVGAMVQNPSTIVNSAVESAPSMLVGAGAGGAAARMAAPLVERGAAKLTAEALAKRAATADIAAGAFGEGATAAGQNAEQVRQEDPNGTLTGQQSAILAGSGMLTGAIGFGAGKVANKLGIGDVQTMAARGKLGAVGPEAAAGANKGLARKLGEGALTEGVLQELPQSYQEQVAQNIAQGKPWDEGAGSAAASGMLAGAAMGAPAAILEGHHTPAPPPKPAGPLARAAALLGNVPQLPAPGGPNTFTAGPNGVMTPGQALDAQNAQSSAVAANPAAGQITEVPGAEGAGGHPIIDVPSRTVDSTGNETPLLPPTQTQTLAYHEAEQADQHLYDQVFGNTGDVTDVEAKTPTTQPSDFSSLLDDDIPWDAEPTGNYSDFLRAVGATDQEIQDAIADESASPQAGAAGGPQAQANGPGNAGTDARAPGSQPQAQSQVGNTHEAAPTQEAPSAHVHAAPAVRTAAPQAPNAVPVAEAPGEHHAQGVVPGPTHQAAAPAPVAAGLDPLGWNPKKLADAYSMEQLNTLYDQVRRDHSNPVVDGGPVEDGKASKHRLNPEGRAKEKALKEAIGTVYERRKSGAEPTINSHIDAHAHGAATSPLNHLPEPTDAQKKAGNYQKGHVPPHLVQGLDVTVENPKGSVRSGVSPDGKKWSRTMTDHYGYARGTVAADGDHHDIYLGPHAETAKTVYVIDQVDQKTGKFDETKSMVGYASKEDAIEAYKSNFDAGWKVGPVTEMSMDDFKAFINDPKRSKQPAAGKVNKLAEAKAKREAEKKAKANDTSGIPASSLTTLDQLPGEAERDAAIKARAKEDAKAAAVADRLGLERNIFRPHSWVADNLNGHDVDLSTKERADGSFEFEVTTFSGGMDAESQTATFATADEAEAHINQVTATPGAVPEEEPFDQEAYYRENGIHDAGPEFTKAEQDAAIKMLPVGTVVQSMHMSPSVTGRVEHVSPPTKGEWDTDYATHVTIHWMDDGKPRRKAHGSHAHFTDFYVRDGKLLTRSNWGARQTAEEWKVLEAAPAEPAPKVNKLAEAKLKRDLNAKTIPEMTDAELAQARDLFGPDHKRTPKILKEIEKRAAATGGTKAQPDVSKTSEESTPPRESLSESDKTVADEQQGTIAERVQRLAARVGKFASGLSRTNDFHPAARADHGIGVDVGELSDKAMRDLAARVVNLHARLFVDSGAFGLFRRNIKSDGDVQAMDFDAVLAKYDKLLQYIHEANEAEEHLTPPMLVMPDVVGDQAESLALVAKYAAWIKTEAGARTSRPVIPLHGGALSLSEAYRQVVEALGSDNFIVGIPSNAKSVSPEQFVEFMRESKPKAVHILGALHDKRLLPRLRQIVEGGADAGVEVTADANILRNQILRGDSAVPRAQRIEDALSGPSIAADKEAQAQYEADKNGEAWWKSLTGEGHRQALAAAGVKLPPEVYWHNISDQNKAKLMAVAPAATPAPRDPATPPGQPRGPVTPTNEQDALKALTDGERVLVHAGTEHEETVWVEEIKVGQKGQTFVVKSKSSDSPVVITKGPVGPDRTMGWGRLDAARQAVKGMDFAPVDVQQTIKGAVSVDHLSNDELDQVAGIFNKPAADFDPDYKPEGVDAINAEIDRLDALEDKLDAEQKAAPWDSEEREQAIRRWDRVRARISELVRSLPDETPAAVEEEKDDEPYTPGENWRDSLYQARTYAKELGIPMEDYSGKSLEQVVKMVAAKAGVPVKAPKAKAAASDLTAKQVPDGYGKDGAMTWAVVNGDGEVVESGFSTKRDADGWIKKPTDRPLAAKPAATKGPDFSGNKLFTADKVQAARDRMKSKLGRLNSGFDPELMADGLTIAGAYIESGVRSFADFARSMVADLGDAIKPYLKSFYNGARDFPGLDTKGMDDHATVAAADVDQLAKVDAPAPAPAPTPEPAPLKSDGRNARDLDQPEGQDGWEHLGYVSGNDGVSYPVDYRTVREVEGGRLTAIRQIRIYDTNSGSYMAAWEWQSSKFANQFLDGLGIETASFHYALSDKTSEAFGANASDGDALWSTYGRDILNEVKRKEGKATEKAPEQPALPKPAAKQTLTESFYDAIKANQMPKDNPALRKMVEQFDGKPADPARMKQAQEELEAAIAMTARDIVAKKEGPRSTFDILRRLYDSQPNLNIRTSTSVANQAYSTPAPLAFLASELAGIKKGDSVLEPTAGTGMLLMGATPSKAHANELEKFRVGLLLDQGFDVTNRDATEGFGQDKYDHVITNPPFGSIKDAKGEPTKVRVDGYLLGQIDHLIAARALEAMKADGRATLIIGANKVAGGLSVDDRVFFNWLYSHYNVTGHFEVNGDLYNRQGAGWPVRVISITGRQASSKVAPVAGTIQRADTWDQVYDHFAASLDSSRAGSNQGTGNRPVGTGTGQASTGSVPGSTRTEGAGPGQRGSKGSATGNGNVSGAGAGVVADSGVPAAKPMGPSGDVERLNSDPVEPDRLDPAGQRARDAARAAADAAKPAGSPDALTSEENQFQAVYVPRSSRKDEGVLIPVNMQQPTQDALSKLEDAVGDIDQFAAKELGYKNVAALHDAFMGLQVDSVASAIHQIQNGKAVVIADQTGIGKGRQAAAIIRWAAKNGHTPVFVSVKPSLFTDMHGDLRDIGTTDIHPFIMNVDESIAGENGEKLYANRKVGHKRRIEGIAQSGQLPDGSNAVFMTYSQINVENAQRAAITALAPNAVFILDESHNAGGESNTGAFIRASLDLAKGVTYLSATYAKRPDNMPLYFKTDMGQAAADDEGLMSAMAAGGLPLQTVVSNNLVKAGQMFRRERSYDGVSIDSITDTANREKHEEMSDRTTEALRAIVDADKMFHHVFVAQLQEEAQSQGGGIIDNAGNQATASVDHTEFSSVVHNFVKQMLLGLKAQESANKAIEALKRGEKPIIAVENTMGSFLNAYAEANGILQGGSLGSFDYRTVLSRALARTLVVTERSPTGDKVKRVIKLAELDPVTRQAYDKAQAVIDDLNIDIPVSPIDWMRSQIEKAGYSVAEITGRNLAVDYSNPLKPVLSAIDQQEQKNKVRTTRLFNSGKLDALVLNVAGSTGISLHASEKFEDQRKRHMIVAQPAGDINIVMQMLGRIHRTGQVKLPSYALLSADLPTEKRPTAVLSGKMKSLNANTSSNTESATSVKTVSMLNKYGDQVVGQYLVDNPSLALDLGILDSMSNNGEAQDDVARKATGRLALQPIAVQKAFYDEVEGQYNTLLDYLNKTNQNELEPRTFDFDAKETRQETLFEGQDPTSPFGEDAIYGEYSIKAQGKPMPLAEIKSAIAESLGGKTDGAEHARSIIDGLTPAYREFHATLEGDSASAADRTAQTGMAFIREHAIGKMFQLSINGEPYNAVVTNIRNTHKKNGNPFSLSKMQVTVALNGALRSVTVPGSKFEAITTNVLNSSSYTVDGVFRLNDEKGARNEREVAKIITGNLLAAYGELTAGTRGTIITFTKQDGTTEQGILLPKAFDFGRNTRGDFRLENGAKALKFLQESEHKDIGRFGIQSRDGIVRVLPDGRGIRVQVPKSKLKGAKYFLDKGLISVFGDFVSSGNFMVAQAEGAEAVKGLDLLMKKQALYALPSMSDEAKAITGHKAGGEQLSIADQVAPTESLDATDMGSIPVDTVFANPARTAKAEKLADRLGVKLTAVEPGMVDEKTAQLLAAVRTTASRLFGHDVVFVEFPKGRTPLFNGAVSEAIPGTVFIRIDSARPHMAVLGHELLHHLRTLDPRLYNELANRLQAVLKDDAMAKHYDAIRDAYAKHGKDAPLHWDEELFADIVGDHFMDPKFWQDMAGQGKLGLFRVVANAVMKFLDRVKRLMTGLSPFGTDQYLSDIDAARAAVVQAMAQFSADQIANPGRAPVKNARPASEDMSVTRGADLLSITADPKELAGQARQAATDFFKTPGKMNWWHKTVGSMYNLAQRSPPFKKVFDGVQDFLKDVSKYATESADLAPRILPKLEKLADLKKTPLTAADTKAISRPIFEGTLTWGRDATGKPIAMKDLEAQYAGLTTDQRARMLLRKGKVNEGQLKRWKESQIDVYDGAVNNRFEAEFLKAGVVWTPAELKSMFGLDDRQVSLYQEFRKATDKSLSDLAVSDMLRFAGKDAEAVRDMVMDAPSVDDAVTLLRQHLVELSDLEAGTAPVSTMSDAEKTAARERAAELMAEADRIEKSADGARMSRAALDIQARIDLLTVKAIDKAQQDLAGADQIMKEVAKLESDLDSAKKKTRSSFFGRAAALRIEAKTLQESTLTPEVGPRGGRAKTLLDTADKILEKAERAKDLMARGYAPLSRFGNYSVDVVDKDGERAYFGLFESRFEAAKKAREMAVNFPGAKITQGTVSQETHKLFAGVSPETLELFGGMLGLEAQEGGQANEAFQQYLKLAKANRSAMKRLIERKGIEGFSEDAGRVLAGFVYSNARQTSNNLHAGQIRQAAADIDKTQGELKDAAIKLTEYVANPQEEAAGFRGLLFTQYIGGSIASAMVNLTQPLQTTMPYLSQFGGIRQAANQVRRAAADALKGSTGDKALDQALKRAEEEGIVSPQEVHQLMAQARGADTLKGGDGTRVGDAVAAGRNFMSRLQFGWGKLFSTAEQFNRRLTFIAAYRTAQAQNMSNPFAFAEKAIAETQFVANKGNRPRWARGAVGSTLFTFKSYSVNYLELMGRMAQSGPEGRKAAALMLGMLFLMGGAGGLPFADDVSDLIDGLMQRLGYNFSTKQKRQEFLEGLFGHAGGQFVEKGISGISGFPLDVSGRMGMGNLIPGTGLLAKKADHTNDVAELFGAGGDFAKRAFQGAGQLVDAKPVDAVFSMMPKAITNLRQGLDMANTGMYRDAGGRKVIDTNGIEAVTKAIGFQPNSVAQVQGATADVQSMVAQNRLRTSEISQMWANGIAQKDPDMVAKARAELVKWNEQNPEARIKIDVPSVMRKARLMMQDKATRIEKAAPKAIRQEVRDDLARGLAS